MPNSGSKIDNGPTAGPFAALFKWENRGLLLDITVFLANLLLMWLLTPMFLVLLRRAGDEDPIALFVTFLLLAGIFVFPPAGAILTRYRYHRKKRGDAETLIGCLCNPIMYFCLQVVIISALQAFLINYVFGISQPEAGVFLGSLFLLLILAILNTYFVFRYFTPPKSEPKNKFLRSHNAELIGDACIFANMLIYQLAWNLMTDGEIFGPVSSFGDFFGRLFFLSFLAFLIYFPPRIFYLAEDIHRPQVWLTMFAANAPVIFRVLFGVAPGFPFS
jgi:hypothetical protein